MARRVSTALRALSVSAALAACDAPGEPRRIEAPDISADAQPVEVGVADAGPSDAAPRDGRFVGLPTIDTAPINACDAAFASVLIEGEAPASVTPIVDDVRGEPVVWSPGAPLMIDLRGLSEGPHTTQFEVDGARLAGPDVHVDRTPPRVTWPVEADACVAGVPAPDVEDWSAVEVAIEDVALGCRTTRTAQVVDACGLSTTARRAWRTGPPGPPLVSGERAYTWRPSDPCTTDISARVGRVGEPSTPYARGQIIEWPGDYQLTLTAVGCNGPVEHVFAVQAPAGPCDRPTRPLDTAPNVRGWLEISSQRLVELSLELSGRDLPEAATPLREAATLLARHPGFPVGCPPREECLIDADWHLILGALARGSVALAGVSDSRSARRCVAEAARVVIAASAYGPVCQAPAQAASLVDAWDDDDARLRARCLCRGDCAPNPRCADAPVLIDTMDPVDFNRQIAALAGPEVLACLDDPRCATLPDLIERTRAAVRSGACAARSLLSVTWLIIGRHCAGVGRFRHPGTDALAAAVGRWPLGEAGAAATLAHLDLGVAACLPAGE